MLNTLGTLSEREVFFILCLRPSATLSSPIECDQKYLQLQFEAYSLSAIATLASYIYPISLDHSYFYDRFRCLASREDPITLPFAIDDSLNPHHKSNFCKVLATELFIPFSAGGIDDSSYHFFSGLQNMYLSSSFLSFMHRKLERLPWAKLRVFGFIFKKLYKMRYLRRKRKVANIEVCQTLFCSKIGGKNI